MSWSLGNSMRLRLQTALENLSDSMYINRAWENSKETSKPQLKSLGLHELKQHKPWFDE